ncbi:hypothetical protein M5K25_020333 [Dendrobium thyrsiflorum]|uniref:GCK domain-containing protein n=1 Tax=Dendrobium thyrsiflorum TaxID=117978 RepID=A0ABD0UGG1_DENTH
MAASSTAATPPTSSTFVSPNTETINQANDLFPSTDSSQSSKLPQTDGNSSHSDIPSNAEEALVVIGESVSMEEDEEVEGEEQEECGFCLFMKGGGCKEPFIAWEKCVEEAEKTGDNVVNKCMEVTSLLKKCMDEHADYYEPILRAEREMADAVSEAEAEKELVLLGLGLCCTRFGPLLLSVWAFTALSLGIWSLSGGTCCLVFLLVLLSCWSSSLMPKKLPFSPCVSSVYLLWRLSRFPVAGPLVSLAGCSVSCAVPLRFLLCCVFRGCLFSSVLGLMA